MVWHALDDFNNDVTRVPKTRDQTKYQSLKLYEFTVPMREIYKIVMTMEYSICTVYRIIKYIRIYSNYSKYCCDVCNILSHSITFYHSLYVYDRYILAYPSPYCPRNHMIPIIPNPPCPPRRAVPRWSQPGMVVWGVYTGRTPINFIISKNKRSSNVYFSVSCYLYFCNLFDTYDLWMCVCFSSLRLSVWTCVSSPHTVSAWTILKLHDILWHQVAPK